MPKFKGLRAPQSQPTPHAEINDLLAAMMAGARAVLGADFVGAYLQGSFALGDADEASDVDFLVAMRGDVTAEQLAGLAALHAELHHRPSFWAERLEGSYFPVAELRRRADHPREPPGEAPRPADWTDPGTGLVGPRTYPVLFLPNGHGDFMRSEHDNTQVVRWVARERGVVLAGPDPRALIEPVSASDLRREIRDLIRNKAPTWLDPAYAIDRNWLWAFFVTLGCRMLQTLAAGEVTSKKAATAWALEGLAPEWRELIRAAWAMGRESVEVRMAPAPLERAEAARAFTRYVIALEAAMPPEPPPMRPGGRGRRG